MLKTREFAEYMPTLSSGRDAIITETYLDAALLCIICSCCSGDASVMRGVLAFESYPINFPTGEDATRKVSSVSATCYHVVGGPLNC